MAVQAGRDRVRYGMSSCGETVKSSCVVFCLGELRIGCFVKARLLVAVAVGIGVSRSGKTS